MVNRPLTLVPLSGPPRMINLSSAPLTNAEGATIGAILRISDLSVRKHGGKEAGKERARSAEGEASASDLELESFIYSVSHDLQAPLRHIIGFSALLNEEFAVDVESTGRGYVDRIRQSCDRIQSLINDLLQLSRKTRGRMFISTVNLSEIARATLDELRQAQPERKVEIDIEADIEVEGDQRLLIELLKHLLDNAWKFTARKQNAIIRFGAERKGDEVHYFVRDNGVGFDMNQAEKLFLPFRRLHGRDYAGNGIGLATALRVINRHHGRIWADAKPEQGATFWFTIG
jgi:light-regulated signal transduction histidine kinase (bacteriophytochrome)